MTELSKEIQGLIERVEDAMGLMTPKECANSKWDHLAAYARREMVMGSPAGKLVARSELLNALKGAE